MNIKQRKIPGCAQGKMEPKQLRGATYSSHFPNYTTIYWLSGKVGYRKRSMHCEQEANNFPSPVVTCPSSVNLLLSNCIFVVSHLLVNLILEPLGECCIMFVVDKHVAHAYRDGFSSADSCGLGTWPHPFMSRDCVTRP